jgi:Ca2+:H+ antiporter
VARKILWASLALAPATLVVDRTIHPDETLLFVLAAIALIPLAWLIGEATEHAGEHTGPAMGGFLNATFGNAPELIIALLAVHKGEVEVVRGSLTGSVVSNLLLVLGFALLFGGDGEIDRRSTFTSLGLVAFAVVLFLVPAVPSWGGSGDPERHSLVVASVPVSIVLLLVYVIVTYRSLSGLPRHVTEPGGRTPWSLRTALVALGAATVVTALVAEVLVGSIEAFAHKAGLTDFFVAAVIVAIVGNAAEHGGAVVVAARGKIRLATEIALASSAQVAVFLIPAVTLLALLIDPLALAFRWVELLAMGVSVLIAGVLLFDGRTSRSHGVVLIASYVGVVAMFFFAGER